jgi:hypothetical protein
MDAFDYSKRLEDINAQIEIMKKEAGELEKMA